MPVPSSSRRSTVIVSTALAVVGTLCLLVPTSAADTRPKAATGSVSPVPVADLAQSATPNPVVDVDGFATFTYRSSTARTVSVVGNFGPSNAALTTQMSQSGSGVFTAIVGPLTPGLYGYSLTVDGTSTVDPANPNVVHSNPRLTMFLVPGKSAKFLTRRNVTHGKLSTLTYQSAVTGTERKATVWTPPGYPRRGTAYSTFYLVHGGGGDYLDWVQQGRANIILDNLYAAGKIPAMVVVMPDGNVPGWNTSPEADTFAPELLDNLIPAVRANFQVSHRKADQALAGLSAGGGQTFNTLLTHPGEFRYVGNFSSGYFPATITALEDSELLGRANVRKINKGTEVFRIYIGNKTDIAYANNIATRSLFDRHGVRYEFNGVFLPSGHTRTTWQHDLYDFAPRIF